MLAKVFFSSTLFHLIYDKPSTTMCEDDGEQSYGSSIAASASISKAKEGWNMVANFFHWHHQKIIECQQETLLLAFAKLRRQHQKAIIRAEERSFQTLQSLDQLCWLKHTNESPVSRQVSFFFLNWKISSCRWKVISHMRLSKLVAPQRHTVGQKT